MCSLYIPSICSGMISVTIRFKLPLTPQRQHQVFSSLTKIFLKRVWLVGRSAWLLCWPWRGSWWNHKSGDFYILVKNSLCIEDVSAYSADDASGNYGRHRSVFENLKSSNPDLIQANCKCHVLQNMAKFSCRLLRYDVEGLVMKVYNKFFSTAKNVEELKSYFELIDEEKYTAIYCGTFQSGGCHYFLLLTCWTKTGRLNAFISCNMKSMRQITAFESSSLTKKTICPMKMISLCHNTTSTSCIISCICFWGTSRRLESQFTHSTDPYEIMNSIRTSLKTRASGKFYGCKVHQILKWLTQHKRDVSCTEAVRVYMSEVCSISRHGFHLGFVEGTFGAQSKREFSFDELMRAVDATRLELSGVNLYDEFGIIHTAMLKLLVQDQPRLT